jgi:hypothetical protein
VHFWDGHGKYASSNYFTTMKSTIARRQCVRNFVKREIAPSGGDFSFDARLLCLLAAGGHPVCVHRHLACAEAHTQLLLELAQQALTAVESVDGHRLTGQQPAQKV